MKILLVGGLGARASSFMHNRVMSSCEAKLDHEYPNLIHYSMNVPDDDFSGDFLGSEWDIQYTLLKTIADIMQPDITIVCCISVTHMFKDFPGYLDPATLLSEKGSTVIGSRTLTSNKNLGEGYHYVEGSGIDSLAATGRIDDREELEYQIRSVNNPVFGCTEYSLIHNDYPSIPNIGILLTDYLIERINLEVRTR